MRRLRCAVNGHASAAQGGTPMSHIHSETDTPTQMKISTGPHVVCDLTMLCSYLRGIRVSIHEGQASRVSCTTIIGW
jgi:hypothetical protein